GERTCQPVVELPVEMLQLLHLPRQAGELDLELLDALEELRLERRLRQCGGRRKDHRGGQQERLQRNGRHRFAAPSPRDLGTAKLASSPGENKAGRGPCGTHPFPSDRRTAAGRPLAPGTALTVFSVPDVLPATSPYWTTVTERR